MAHTPEAEGQEVSIGELNQGEELEEEVYEPPKCAKRVYQSKEKDFLEDDEDLPSIAMVSARASS